MSRARRSTENGKGLSTVSSLPPHLKALEEIERECIPGLVEVLREEGIEAVRYALWDMTGWHRNYESLHLEEQSHRGAEAGRLGDVGEDGKDTRRGPPRGP